jgi:hypothetical protein
MGFKTAGFPKFGFNPLGFKSSGLPLWRQLVKDCGLIMYIPSFTSGDGIDKVGSETRPSVKAKYILGDDILTADLELINEPVTYLDVDTKLDVSTTTDASGLFTFPNGVKVANIKIPSDGSIFYLQEGLGDTIADSVNGRIAKLSSVPTFVDVNDIQSQADLVGYTVKELGDGLFWDEALTDEPVIGVIIPNLTFTQSVAYKYVAPVEEWILQNGVWNDGGAWDDSSVWIDNI